MTIDPQHLYSIQEGIEKQKQINNLISELNDSMRKILVDIINSEDIVMLNEYLDMMPSGGPRARLIDRIEELEYRKEHQPLDKR